jgi:hypothetical protein
MARIILRREMLFGAILSASLRAALLARGLLPPNKTCPLTWDHKQMPPAKPSFCLARTNLSLLPNDSERGCFAATK